MPRTSHHTREKFIEAGINLVQQQSLDGIGVAEIAKVSGAPKGSFYNHFASKEEFGAAMIDAFVEQEVLQMKELYDNAQGTPLEKMKAMVATFRDHFVETGFDGCLVGSMSATSGGSPMCQEAATRAFERSQSVLQGFFEDAQKAGEISADADSQRLARVLQNTIQGALIIAKAKGTREAFDDVLDGFFPLLAHS